DTVAPLIVSDTLPAGNSGNLVFSFTLNFNKDMDPLTVNAPSNYSLLWAGPDGVFSSGDDAVIPITPGNYTAGLSNNYVISQSPLQPGNYRFTASTSIRDKFANPLPIAYQKLFT